MIPRNLARISSALAVWRLEFLELKVQLQNPTEEVTRRCGMSEPCWKVYHQVPT